MADTTANLGLHYSLQSPFNALEARRYLDEIDAAAARLCIFVDDRGAIGDGATDDAAAIQSAADELAALGGGAVKFTAGKTYLSSNVQVKRAITIDLNGATVKAKTSADNFLFSVANNVLDSTRAVASDQKAGTTSLTTALKDALSITVGSTTGILAGDRIIISGGPWTGSGVEHGPIEFNTVVTVTDATHLVVKTPLKYSYSAMGMTGAAPFIQNLGAESNLRTDVRITNGYLIENGTDNTLYFGIVNTERVEIDHLTFLSKGDAVFALIYCANVKIHHNIGYGPSANDTTITTAAGFVESKFTDNSFAFDKAASGSNRGDENATVWEVMTRDNIFARNYLYNLDATNAGSVIAFNFTFGAFNNIIASNHAFGVNPSNSHFDLWFARTYENAGNAVNFGSNHFSDNVIIDFMNGIGDAQTGTVVTGNTHKNNSVQSFSGFFTGLDDLAIFGVNYTQNVVTAARNPSSAVIRTRSLPAGDRGFIWGDGSPQSAATASIGAAYFRNDGGRSSTVYAKESGTGNTGWAALVSVGSITASGLTMATAKLLGRSTSSTGAVEEIAIGANLTLSGGTLSAAGASGATTALDNLALVAINASLLPATTNAIDLGSSSLTWRDGYFGTSIGVGTIGSADFTQHKFQVKDNVNSGISYPLAIANLAATGGDGNGVGIDFYVRDVPGASNRLAGAIVASYSDVNNQRTKLVFQVKSGGSDRVEVLSLAHNGDATITGLLKAGSGPTTLTDSVGKILSAALNTVGTAQGGTGVDNSTGGTANQFWARPNGSTGAAAYRAIVAADIPTLNQSTSGNAATATALATARTIGGVSFDGTANITVATATGGFTISGGTGLNLASGAVINFNSGNYTITHAAGLLTLAGGKFDVGGTCRASGQNSAFGSGAGIEFSYASGVGYIQSYDRTGGADKDLYISGHLIQIARDGGVLAVTVSATGAMRFHAYGAGALTTDASGNITAASDERIKRDIRPFTRGLKEVLQLQPILHGYTLRSGLDQTKDDYAGFSAQNVQRFIPEAVGHDDQGFLTLADRPILGALVNADKELNDRIKALEAKIADLEKHKN